MGVRRRAAWSLDEVVLRMSSVQGNIVNHIMADISEGINTQKIRAGSIKATEYVESDNFLTGSLGWRIDGDGTAEFNDVIIRNAIYVMPAGTSFPVSPDDGEMFHRTDENIAYRYDSDNTQWLPLDYIGAGARIANAIIGNAHISDLSADKIDTGTLAAARIATNSLSVDKISGGTYGNSDIVFSSGSDLESSNFVAGTSGWQIQGDGSAEFNNVTVRGTIYATAGEIGGLTVNGTLTLGSGGLFRTAASGTRLEISQTDDDRITFHNASTQVGHIGATYTGSDYLEIESNLSGTTAQLNVKAVGSDNATVFISGRGKAASFVDAVNIFAVESPTSGYSYALGIGNANNTNAVRVVVRNNAGNTEHWGKIWINDEGSAARPAIAEIGDTNTGIYFPGADQLAISTGGVVRATFRNATSGQMLAQSGTKALPFYSWSGDGNTGMYWPAADTIGFSVGGEDRLRFAYQSGSGTGIYIHEDLTDVGNHETLRANRGAGGSGLVEMGYYSSWAENKRDIIPLVDSPRFPGLDVIDNIGVYDIERKSTEEREWTFLLDNFKEIDDRLRYLTTKGDKWGYSPDEQAVSAFQMLAIQDLRRRVAALEAT